MDARWLSLTVLTIARVSLGFQFQSLASIAPPLRQALGMSYADIGFLIGLYMSPGILLAMPGGALGRRFGDKRMVCLGLALMAVGGALTGFAESYATIVFGRLMSGIGGVLLNVLMSKMITDWFAGREIVLAMAVFINSFPIGIGLALLTLGWLAESHGWAAALHATAALALASLLLVVFVYRRHPNDGKATSADPSATGPTPTGIERREAALVCLAGAIWGVYNGAHAIVVGFTPILLTQHGLTAGAAGSLLGLSAWLLVFSVQLGGLVAQRWGHANLLMVAGILLWGVGLLVLPSSDPAPVLIAVGLLQGLPVGIIVALPAAVLRPQSRAVGMGIFYTWLYLGHAALPALAGWLQDRSGNPATSLYFAAALVFSILALFAAFRLLPRRALPSARPATG